MEALPQMLYIQYGMNRGGETLMPNRTPEGALKRELGTGEPAGRYVGVYKLERVVAIKSGVIVDDVAVGTPAPTISETEGTTSQS